MKIIIVGAGEIGRHLAEKLSREAHHIVVIESDDGLASDLENQIDAKVICGNGSSVDVLLEAGIDECELFLAVTSTDDTNLVACSIARELGAQKTLCRVHPPVQREEWLFDYRNRFGIDYLFSSERLAAIELSKFVRTPNALSADEIARGHIEMQQLQITSDSKSVGQSLRDLKLPERVRIGAIQRGDELIIPSADDELREKDVVTIFGEPRKLQDVAGKLGHGVDQESLSVVIFGGNEYGIALAQMLQPWNCKIRIFETDAARCEDLTERLPDATILNIDATSLTELREERVGEADFFVATTQSDEDNVMTCLQAHNLGTKHCLTLIHRADYAAAIGSFSKHVGIMAAVSPREASRKELMRFVTSDRYHIVKELPDAELIEATVTEKCAIANRKVSEIKWPSGSLLVALLHGVHASVPAAGDVIQKGDNIYAIVSKKAKRGFLKLLKKSLL